MWQEISGGQDEIDLGRRKMASRAYCALFNFRGADQQKNVGQLSGGERNRVHIAKMLKTGANVLLLDEPTNDLDVDTLRALEEALLDFPGCAVIITHDRWFLDRVATHILAFEGDSQVIWFEGNYADYEADRRRRLGAEAEQPHRIRYKPLTRADCSARGGTGDPLTQHCDQPLHLPAIVLNDGCEFGTLGDGHADSVNRYIADLVSTVSARSAASRP